MERQLLTPPEKKFSTPQEELGYLREQVARQQESGGRISEKALVEQVGVYANADTGSVLAEGHALSENELEGIVLDLKPEAHDETMGELLQVLEEKGVKNALRVVEKLGNPHLTDDFHRVLVAYIKAGHPLRGLAKRSSLSRSLSYVLYEIALPRGQVEREKGLKELISSMEQLYAGMLSAANLNKESISLEIAVSQESEEVVFYLALPRSRRELFEKHIISIFPKARVTESADDYNIFTASGAVCASVGSFARHGAYPIRTYDDFEYDPLNVILSAFSKLDKESEGAAVQLVISPDAGRHNKQFKNALEKIEKGTPLREALAPEGFLGGIVKGMEELFSGTKKRDSDRAPVDQIAVEQIRNKIDSPIVRASLKIITSAKNPARAEAILSEFEASFGQFEEAQGNAFMFSRVKGRKLSRILKEFSFRLPGSTPMPLNLKELSTLYHLEGSQISSREVRQSKAQEAPAPLDLPKDGVFLGMNRFGTTETPVRITPEDRLRHLYAIGQTGTGKSTLLKNMVKADIENGDGVCMIDPHGSDIVDVLASIPTERYKDVIYFDPGDTAYPIGLNMLEYDPRFPEQKTFVVNEMLSIFNKLFDMNTAGGPAFEQYFRNSALLVMEHPESGSTLFDIGRVLSDSSFRALKLSHSNTPTLNEFWENAEKTSGEQSLANFVPYITNKFDVFTTNEIMRPIVGQEKSALNFRSIMDERKILLVNLSKGRLGDINAHLLGLILVGKILMAALSRADSYGKDLPNFYLYIDEFQNVTTNSISTILSEARKYRLGLTIAHQFIAQLQEGIRDSVFGNVGSMCAFRVGSDDAEYLKRQFEPVFDAQDIMNIDNWNAYVKLLVGGKPARPFNISIPPFTAGGADVNRLRELSQLTYGRPRDEVEKEIRAKYSAHTNS